MIVTTRKRKTAFRPATFVVVLSVIANLSISGVQSQLTAAVLQKCINKCMEVGHCCGNRLNGEAPDSSNQHLSCANGCEIAYHSTKKSECKDSCETGNQSGCGFKHPSIDTEFSKCGNCQDGCDGWQTDEECSVGCDKAFSFTEFYNPCADDPAWGYQGKSNRSCLNWVKKNKANRCKKKETEGVHAGKKIWKICPETCSCHFKTCKPCPNSNSCANDPSFKYNGNPKRTCNGWVKKKKWNRCKLEGVSEGCPMTCKTVRQVGSCGKNGRKLEMCKQKKWTNMGCIQREKFGLIAGFHAADVIRSSRIYGWSYYIRAFDLIQDTPVEELGYGQWTSGDIVGGGEAQEVCGRHPNSFVCGSSSPSEDDMNGEYKNCGSMNLNKLEQCEAGCCGDGGNKCGIGGGSNIEGGMGYWMYTLAHPHVKWMGLAAVNHRWTMIGRTFLDTVRQMCTSLGGSVRVSNNLVVGNDPMQFYPGEGGVDGFLGYMLTRTPIGRRSDEDEGNYWTVIVDTENFSGPVYYVSTWFWDALASWSPKSKTFGNPEALITYAQTGFEGNVGAYSLTADDGSKWVRTNRVSVPQDEIDGVLSDSFTLYTGFSTYKSDWASDAMEPMLSGNGASNSQTIQYIRQAALADREQTPKCHYDAPFYDGWFEAWRGPWQLYTGKRQVDWKIFGGFGIGEDFNQNFDAAEYDEGSKAASCHTRFKLDTSKLQCEAGFCAADNYLRLDDKDSNYITKKVKEVPSDVRKALSFMNFEPTRINSGKSLGPPLEDEKACFEKPGPAPANSKLYCTRLLSGTWLGFKWYRFVDQPELNQVFASMDSSERDAAKCYMQARIERLHEATATGNGVPRWFRPPQGDDKLPKGRVRFDPGYLVTPPEGLEKGFVPIVVWERNKEVPEGCDVFLGASSEPDPFPEGYYDGNGYDPNNYRVREQCPANLESSGPFEFPGTVYPYPAKDYNSPRNGYDAPAKEDVGNALDDDPVTCNLKSDAPADLSTIFD